jgi:probable HAF family extracellular repeat protein
MTHMAGLPDGTEPSAINDRGQVAGTFRTPSTGLLQGVLWTPDGPNATTGTMTELGTLNGFGESEALAMNGFGQIVGHSTASAFGDEHAFLWTPDRPNGTTGRMVDLGVLRGPDSTASGINDAGVVVGWSRRDDEHALFHAFRWTPTARNATTGAMSDLGILPGDNQSFATGINRRGDIVGYGSAGLFADEVVRRPFMSTGGPLLPFARMPAVFDAFALSGARVPGEFRPNAVSDRGAVVGWTFDGSGRVLWPVLWTPTIPNGTAGAFLQLPDAGNAQAVALNDHAQVVGINSTPSNDRAMLWTLTSHGLKVAIDIKPGDASNVIKPGSSGTLPVAILSSKSFDAATVWPISVTVANAVVALRPDGEPRASLKDVNRDGRLDLLLHVSKDALTLPRSSGRAELCGETMTPGARGVVIEGTDAVRVVSPVRSSDR